MKEGTFDVLNYDVYRVDNNPITASATSLWDDISSGALYENDEWVSNPPDWEWSNLNNPGNSDLQNALLVNWFALGYMVDCSEDDATYFARFRGYDASASYRPYLAITYTVNAPQPPTLSSPSDGSSSPSPVTFRWRSSIGADSYRLQVAKDNAFTDLAYNQGSITDTSRQVNLPSGTYYWHVNAINTLPSNYSAYWKIVVITSSVEQIADIRPESYSLSQNYPNPFNPMTTIDFSIPKQGFVVLTIFNSLGMQIEVLMNQHLQPGHYRTQWTPSDIPSGMYFYRIQAGDFVETKKLILLK